MFSERSPGPPHADQEKCALFVPGGLGCSVSTPAVYLVVSVHQEKMSYRHDLVVD